MKKLREIFACSNHGLCMNRIITVSREFGSGGRTIGRKAAEALNIPCYDHELIEKIAEESGFAHSFIAEHGEYVQKGFLANAFSARPFGNLSAQDYLWTIQRKVILDIAERESCVIVGRCADYILKDVADCLTVFIHADMETRAHRIVNLYGETDSTPEKRLADKDKRRRSYYQFYTEMEWGIARNYDVSLDSGVIGIDRCAELIASLY